MTDLDRRVSATATTALPLSSDPLAEFDLLVVGGGAAGFMAAITAAEAGLQRVLVLEATAEPLTKVRLSGGGRCNVTHACWDPGELVSHYPRGQRPLGGRSAALPVVIPLHGLPTVAWIWWRKTMAECFLRPIAPPRWWIASGRLHDGLGFS